MIYIFWTCSGPEEAEKVICGLLEERLIACASLLPPVTSLYRWEGKIERAKESKVILKSKGELFEKIFAYIQNHCSYEVPEIAAIQASQVFEPYLKWLFEETTN